MRVSQLTKSCRVGVTVALAMLAVLASCSSDLGPAPSSQVSAESTVFSPGITTVVLEVGYASGAVPHAEPSAMDGKTVWNLFKRNISEVLPGDKRLESPLTLQEMRELPDVTGTSFTQAQILEIARTHRTRTSDKTTIAYYALWLPGILNDGTRDRDDVLGVNFRDTTVIAMFKPVLEGNAEESEHDRVAKFAEQSVLIHELGHAMGLVNKTIPLTSSHHDSPHGAHCTNQDCLMYYANEESRDSLTSYIKRMVTDPNALLWGPECLRDFEGVRPKGSPPPIPYDGGVVPAAGMGMHDGGMGDGGMRDGGMHDGGMRDGGMRDGGR